MTATNRCPIWIILVGMVAITLGCSSAPPVVEPPPLEVVISQPVTEKIEDWDVYTGTLDAKDFVEIKSRVRGHIKEVFFKEGEEIPAGKELFLIDEEPFKADLAKAKGDLATAEARKKLADDQMAFTSPWRKRARYPRRSCSR